MKVAIALGVALLCMHMCSFSDGAVANQKEDPRKLFEAFKLKWKKHYDAKEDENRFKIFSENLNEIDRLNSRPRKGSVVYGVTKYADLTKQEFMGRHSSPKLQTVVRDGDHNFEDFSVAPTNYSWSDVMGDTPVLDEGDIHSSNTQAVTYVLEALNYVHTKQLVQLADEQIRKCGKGRNAKTHLEAFEAVIAHRGIKSKAQFDSETEKAQCRLGNGPTVRGLTWTLHITYTADEKNTTAQPRTTIAPTTPKPKSNVPGPATVVLRDTITINHNEEGMKNFVYNKGPIVVSINGADMQFYKSGVSIADASVCSPNPNRYIAIVGYGFEVIGSELVPYWIAKNNLGDNWGEHGFYRFHRGSNFCGVRTDPLSAAIDLTYKVPGEANGEKFTYKPKPAAATTVPVTTVKPKPAAATKVPVTTVKPKPAAATKVPVTTVKPKPAAATNVPVTTVKPKPAAATKVPVTTAKPKPAAATKVPVTTAKPKPAAATKVPVTTVKPKPAAVTKVPVTTVKPKPAAATTVPVTTAKPKPAAATNVPVTTVKPKPAAATKVPVTTAKPKLTTVDPNGTCMVICGATTASVPQHKMRELLAYGKIVLTRRPNHLIKPAIDKRPQNQKIEGETEGPPNDYP